MNWLDKLEQKWGNKGIPNITTVFLISYCLMTFSIVLSTLYDILKIPTNNNIAQLKIINALFKFTTDN